MEAVEYIKALPTYNNFKEDIVGDRLFHTIMLINKDEEFLYLYAKALAQLILSKNALRPADVEVKVEKEIHPDMFVFGKEKPIDASVAKEIVNSSLVAPFEGDKKVYIITKFDECLASPANKLLKTLEDRKSVV